MAGFSGVLHSTGLQGGYLTALFTISHLSMDTLTSMPMALLPLLQSRFDLAKSTIALIVATLSFSSSVTQPVFGALADRSGRRFVAAPGLILNAVLLSLIGVVPTRCSDVRVIFHRRIRFGCTPVPGSAAFYAAVILSGVLVHASLPLLVVSAQNLAPNAMATASGMLMGFGAGIAGLLYIGIGHLQETIGLVSAIHLGYLVVIPAGLLAYVVLSKTHSTSDEQQQNFLARGHLWGRWTSSRLSVWQNHDRIDYCLR